MKRVVLPPPAALLLALSASVACSARTPDAGRTSAGGTAGVAFGAGGVRAASSGAGGVPSGGSVDQGGSSGEALLGKGGSSSSGGFAGGAVEGGGGSLAVAGAAQAGRGGERASAGAMNGAGRGGANGPGGRTNGGASSGGRAGAETAGAGTGAGSAGASAVVCPSLDPQTPPQMLALSGNLGTHDPSLIAADGEYYLFQTGPRLPTKTSMDLTNWQAGSAVFSANPAWIALKVPAATDLWAPDISYFGGVYHLYYAASSFGSNTSCIGHATRASLTAGTWTDQGSVVCSGSSDDYNAIDPNVIVDDAGTPWLAFGSFWGGIKLTELDATGTPVSAQLHSIAARPKAGGALEGAYIVHVCGYYYLFVSWDHCCDAPWNYNIRVGRATNVTGPYTDRTGAALADGGGTLLVAGDTTWTAPGHNAVIVTQNGAYNVYHALDANHANPSLRVTEIAWDGDAWPVSAGP